MVSEQTGEYGQQHQAHTGERTQGTTSQERTYRGGDYQQGQTTGMLSGAAEATGDLATTAVRSVVDVGEEVISGIGRLANGGVIEISRFLITAAGGIRGTIGTIVTGRPPQEYQTLLEHHQQGYRSQGRQYGTGSQYSGTGRSETTRAAQQESQTPPGTTI